MNRLLHFLEQGVFPVPCPPEIPDKFAASSCLSLLLATLDETCQALSKVLYSATATVSAHVCPCLPMSAHGLLLQGKDRCKPLVPVENNHEQSKEIIQSKPALTLMRLYRLLKNVKDIKAENSQFTEAL